MVEWNTLNDETKNLTKTDTESCFLKPSFFFFQDQILRHWNRSPPKIDKSLETEKFQNRNVTLWWHIPKKNERNERKGVGLWNEQWGYIAFCTIERRRKGVIILHFGEMGDISSLLLEQCWMEHGQRLSYKCSLSSLKTYFGILNPTLWSIIQDLNWFVC